MKEAKHNILHFRASSAFLFDLRDAADLLGVKPSELVRMAVAEKVAQIRAMNSPNAKRRTARKTRGETEPE